MSTCIDPSCRLLAAQYLRKQCKQLLAQFAGIRQAADVEFIHHARVASRRLRAALRIFGDCLPKGPLKRWKRQVRCVTQGLGMARDLDVQHAYLVQVLTQLEASAYCAGIARLLVRTNLQRDQTQREVLKALDRLEKSEVLQDMRKALKPAQGRQDEDNPLHTAACFHMAEHHIGERLGEMLSLEDCLDDPNDAQQHHAMRIAAKRLRYTMEICRPVYGARIDAPLEAVKQLQSLLGEVHDCDVWIEKLPRMLEEERRWIVKCYGHAGPLDQLKPGVDYLILRRQQQRQERFTTLATFWQEHSRRETWPKLADILRQGHSPAAEPITTAALGGDGCEAGCPPAPCSPVSVPAQGDGTSPPGPERSAPAASEQ